MELDSTHYPLSYSLVLVLASCAAVDRPRAVEYEPSSVDLPVDSSTTEAYEPPESLGTLEDCIAYAERHSPALEAAHARWLAAVERLHESGSLPDPRLTLRHFTTDIETRVGPQRNAVGLSQTLPIAGKLGLEQDAASEAAAALQAEYEARRFAVIREVREIWFESYHLERAIEVVGRNVELVAYLEQVAGAGFAAGAEAHANVLRAQVELERLRDRQRTLSSMRRPQRAALNAAVGRPPGAPLTIPTAMPERRVSVTDDELRAWLAVANPRLAAADHRVLQGRARIERAKKDVWPDVTIGVDWIDIGSAEQSGTSGSGDDAVSVMLSMALPVHRGRLRAREREAEQLYRANVLDREDLGLRLGADAERVLFDLRDAERKLELHRQTLIPKAHDAVRSTEVDFRAGTASFQGLIDVERALLELELAYERAVANHGRALAALEELVARPIPVSVGTSPQQKESR